MSQRVHIGHPVRQNHAYLRKPPDGPLTDRPWTDGQKPSCLEAPLADRFLSAVGQRNLLQVFDSLVAERALYDAAIRGVTEGDPRAVATLAILGDWPEPEPPARPDPSRSLNSRVERVHSAFLFTREIALGGLGDALHAAGRHAEAEAVLTDGEGRELKLMSARLAAETERLSGIVREA